MQIGNPSSASIAASVWAFTGARQLSSIQNLQTPFNASPSVGAGLILDLRPAAGKQREVGVMIMSGGTQFADGYYDGTTFTSQTVTGVVKPHQVGGISTLGYALKNVTAGAISVTYLGFDWS